MLLSVLVDMLRGFQPSNAKSVPGLQSASAFKCQECSRVAECFQHSSIKNVPRLQSTFSLQASIVVQDCRVLSAFKHQECSRIAECFQPSSAKSVLCLYRLNAFSFSELQSLFAPQNTEVLSWRIFVCHMR